jgi:membrane protease YdiL (CAAX protease family)
MDWGMFAVTTGFLILLLGGYLSLDNVHLDLSNLIISITLFIIVALNEEIMIRGYVLGNLSESYNRYSALLISAAIFMLLHLANAHLSPIALLNLFLAGVLLGVYYIFQRNLWFSIGLHFTWNFFQGPVYGFEVSGLKTDRIFHSSVKGSALITGGDFGFEGSLLATVIILLMIYFIHQKYRIEISRK